jgi:hypothetical protein
LKTLTAIAAVACLALAACSAEVVDADIVPAEGTGSTAAKAVEAEAAAPIPEPVFGVDVRPVRIGFNGSDFDACGSYGEIGGLNLDGDNFLSVRGAPNSNADEIDRLTSGTGVSICENADGWIGIVYEGSGAAGTGCDVGSPVPQVRDYDGSCRSGWVSQRFVEMIAG